MGVRTCSKCREEKPLSEFTRSKNEVSGRFYYCKSCRGSIQRAYRQKNKEKIREYKRQWRKKNPYRKPGYDGARRARLLGQLGEVPPDYQKVLHELQKGKCYYCKDLLMDGDIHLEHMAPLCRGGMHDKSNLCLACSDCNFRKNSLTAEEFMGKN